MKNFFPLILAVALQAIPSGPDAIRPKLQAIYDAADALKTKKDVPGLTKFFKDTRTPDYQFLAKSGKHDLKDVIDGMTMGMKMIGKVSKATVHIDRLITKKDVAIATITTSFVFVTVPLEDHHPHIISEQNVAIDDWVSVHGVWKLQQSRSKSEQYYRDGRALKI